MSDRVIELYTHEFELLIAKQKSSELDIGDLRRLDILTRSYKAYISNPIKKDVEEDLSLYSDEVLKKILNGTKIPEPESSRFYENDICGKTDTVESP